MADSESTREGGRGRGRGKASRKSRRAQGLPPEETKSLDEVNKERRQAAAAKRKAAKEQKEREEPRDFQFQPDSEPPAQDAHQATPDGDDKVGSNEEVSGDPAEDSSSDSSVEVMGASGPDAPTQASVGGAVKVESSAEGGTSVPPRPSQNVQEEIVISDDDLEPEEKRPAHEVTLDEAPTIKREGPLSTVKEEATAPDASVSARPKSEPSPTDVALPPSRESSLGTPPSPAPRTDVDLTSEKSEEGRPEWMSVEQAKAYVAEQVRRWERVVVEYVVSPTVRYEWPAASPDFQAWWRAMTLTTEYVLSRTAMTAQSEAWISEWALARMGPNTAEDIAAIVVPPSTLSPRECMALLQTLFFEAGFRFRNLIPEWFRTQASRVDPNLIRRVTEDLQHLLAAELLEWRSITTGVATRMVSAEEAQALENQNTPEDVKAEDQDGDLLMSTYEADLMGKDFVSRLKVAGIRPTCSPTSSYTGEPDLKRQYLRTTSVPSMDSHLSIHSSALLSQSASNPSDRMSVAPSTVSRRSSDIFGPSALDSEESSRSATSGSRSSGRYSSSSSSMWSIGGGGAAAHMPYAGPSGLVLTAQGGGVAAQDVGGMSVQITRSALPGPPAQVDPGDVVMAESGRARVRSGHRSRSSHEHARPRKSSPSESPSDSSSDDESWRERRSSKRHGRSKRSVKSERSSYSGRSARSSMSGASQVALNAMKSTQDALSRMEAKQDERLAQQDANMNQAFQAIQTLAAQAAAQEERLLQTLQSRMKVPEAAPPPPVVPQFVTPEAVEAVRAEAAQRAREAAQAEIEQRLQQFQAGVEAEKASWSSSFQQSLNAQIESFQQKIQALEEARRRDQATIRTLRNVPGTFSSNLPATLPQVQDGQGSVNPDSATRTRSDPHPATVSSNAIPGNASGQSKNPASPTVSDLPAAQKRAIMQGIPDVGNVKREPAVKEEAGIQAAASSSSRASAPKTASKSKEPQKPEDKKPAREDSHKKPSRRHGGRSDPDPDSDPDSSGDDYDDDDSDSSSDGVPAHSSTPTTLQDGTTVTFKQYVNSSTLEDFNEKASLAARRRWWERFLNMAIQAGWSDELKVYELKLKMSPAVRNWRGQLKKIVRTDWTRLSRAFKREYCKSKLSDAEKYYTIRQYKDETALAFLYRLNLAAEQADVKFRSSERQREQHIKRFMKTIADDQLRATLQSQRFRKVSDLEYVLKQQEEVRQSEGRPGRAPQIRDSRVDNVIRDRFRPKRQDRAYVAQDGDDPGLESAQYPEVSDDLPFPDEPASDLTAPDADIPDAVFNPATMTREELIHEVYRIMGNVGWPNQRPPVPNGGQAGQRQTPSPPYPRRDNPDRDEQCGDCGRWGHKASNCFQTRVCERCNRRGHAKEECNTRPCPKCKQFHDGKCDDWKALQDLKKLLIQGDLPDLPSHIRDAILGGKANSDGAQLNH